MRQTAEKVISVTATCPEGHSQTLFIDQKLGLEWAKNWAGLMDGSSPLYVYPPDKDSVIGKCGICGSKIKCTVEDAVDRSKRVLSSGKPVPVDQSHTELDATGQQKGYVVLSQEERLKGFVRPVRCEYKHVGKLQTFSNPDHPDPARRADTWTQRVGGCGTITRMGQSIAETYARDPKFYSGTFCVGCHTHLPLDEFVWKGTDEEVGS